MSELEDLMNEKQYIEVMSLCTMLEEYQESGRMARYGSNAIFRTISGLRAIANSLYRLREEIYVVDHQRNDDDVQCSL